MSPVPTVVPAKIPAPASAAKPAVTEASTPKPPAAPGQNRNAAPDLLSIARLIAREVGQPLAHSTEVNTPGVIIFEETHTSIPCQLEIAIMLNRLYRDHGMKDIALEGFVKGTKAETSWFHKVPATPADRKVIAARMLASGEVSDAECLALAYPDVTLHPIEDDGIYRVSLPNKAGGAGLIYLVRIGLQQLQNDPQKAQAHLSKIQELKRDQSKLIDYILETDPWISSRAREFRRKDNPLQAEKILDILGEIERKADDVGASISNEEKEAMRGLKAFFDARNRATDVMVDATVDVLSRANDSVVAMIIGAAHENRTAKAMAERKVHYVLIRPNSLLVATDSISMAAFERKNAKLSVDEDGLGRLLDGRKKSPPIVSVPWFQAEGDLLLITRKLATRAAGGGNPPPPHDPPFGLGPDDFTMPGVRIDPSTIIRDGSEVVFQAILFPDDETRRRSLWIRGAYVGGVSQPTSNDIDFEQYLMAMKDKTVGPAVTGSTGKPSRIEVDDKVLMEYGQTRADVNTRITS